MAYHSDEIPLDIGFSLTGLLPIHCAYSILVTKKKIFFLDYDFQETCIF